LLLPALSAENANAVIAATKGIVILVNMVIFSSCRKRIAFADWIGQSVDYSLACAGTESAWSASAHFAQRTPIASLLSGSRCGTGLAASSLSTTHCVLADPASREDVATPIASA
jgi:hypothetical protein